MEFVGAFRFRFADFGLRIWGPTGVLVKVLATGQKAFASVTAHFGCFFRRYPLTGV